MKNLCSALFLILFLSHLQSNAQTVEPPDTRENNLIQLALLLDVSSSMNGLIDQAKTELWTIVNEVAKAKKNQENSKLEIALYEYGRSTNSKDKGYVVKLLDYTSDLDTISKVLFSLTTNGGDEYCGLVIENALEELQWIDNQEIYRVIFIAGNEPFNQGTSDYKKSCGNATERGIFVNTIHCGDSMIGVRTFWKEGASLGNGEYFFINHNSKSYDIPTPYDSLIGVYNDSLNTTYWHYGSAGAAYKSEQVRQDKNAKDMSAAVKAKRAVSKTKAVYKNSKWDVLDAAEADSSWLEKTEDSKLPENLKGKTGEEKKIILDSLAQERQHYKEEIAKLNIMRETYLRENKPVKSEKSLGTALVEAIHRQSQGLGFVFE